MKNPHAKNTVTGNKAARGTAAIVLAVLLCLIVAFAATGCDDNTAPDAAALRAEAVDAFRGNVLAAAGDGWRADMSFDEIASLENPASYIVTSAWLDALAQVVSDSSLQTAKISYAADFALTEDGKSLIDDAAANLDGALAFVRGVGLTESDVCDLGFRLMRMAVADTTSVYADAKRDLNEVLTRLTGEDRTPVREEIARIDRVLDTYFADEATVAEATEALDSAESGIKTLLSFLYSMQNIIGTGASGDGLVALLGSMSSGALADISDSEMFVWLDSLIKSVTAFGESMTAEEIKELETALDTVERCFDSFVQPVEAVEEILDALDYVRAFVGQVPEVVSYFTAAFSPLYERGEDGAYTYSLVSFMKELAAEKDENLRTVNSMVLAAKLLESFGRAFSAEELKSTVLSVSERGDEGKTVLYIVAIMRLMGNDTIPEGVDEGALVQMLGHIIDEIFASNLGRAYRSWVLSPDEKSEKRLRNWASIAINTVKETNELLEAEGIEPVKITVTSDDEITDAWYNAVTEAAEEAGRKADSLPGAAELVQTALGMANDGVDEFFAALDDLGAVGGLDYITSSDSEEAELVMQTALRVPAIYLVVMLFGV